jgi:imidazoleglycerol-phosphate dehydratase/histidinol-phosphatase
MKKYAFIDRDGTLIYEPQDTFVVDSVDSLRILPGVFETLKYLQDQGYALVMVTNQDGLGTKSFPSRIFNAVQEALMSRLKKHEINFDEVLICPHWPDDNCSCRKPKTGLVDRLDDIDKASSVVIGDRQTDIEFAKNLAVKAIKVETNQGLGGIKL